jgi:ParB/RepB/Spo0J family partition protein
MSKRAKQQAEPGEGRALVAPALQRRRVPVNRIFSAPEKNFRGEPDGAALGELVQSMAEVGQLMPVQLHPATDGEDQWDVVFGYRRLSAARNLGWMEILADCHPQRLDPREVYRLRAVENLQRENLSPLEEATAVYALLAEVTGIKRFAPAEIDAERSVDLKPESVREVAALIGKSEAWVRDRAVLIRLSPKVREAVGRGLLPLGHARELAKLADPKDQDDLLGAFERREDGSGGSDIERCRRLVAERMRTLKGTRFRLDVPFAGHAACLDCPHNSVKAMALFTTGGKTELEEARCLDGSCFAEKSESAERLFQKAVAEAEKRKLAATPLGISPVLPDGLKTAAVIRELKKRRGELPAAQPKDGPPPRQADGPQDRLRTAVTRWRAAAAEKIWQAARQDPLRTAALFLALQVNDFGNWPWEPPDAMAADLRRKAKLIVIDVARADAGAIRRLGARLARIELAAPAGLDQVDATLLGDVAAGWEVKIEAPPTIEKFQDPQTAAKPKGKTKAKARGK